MSLKVSSAPVSESLGDFRRKFPAIVRHYRRYYSRPEYEEAGPYRLTALGAWATSRAPHVFYFFRKVGLSQYRLFLDLGSGDGIVTCIAGLFTRAVGIEIDPDLCQTARKSACLLGLGERAQFVRADFLTQHIRNADCLYLYPDKPFYALEELLAGWQGTLMVYGSHIPPKRMTPVQQLRRGREQFVLYRNPEFIADDRNDAARSS